MSFNGWSWRAFARPIGILSIGAVVAAGLVTTPSAVAADPAVAPKSAKTAAEAGRLAAQFNTSVEVEDQTTEYVRTVATPQGTMQAEVSNQPVRTRKGNAWVDIDSTLVIRSDGLVAPRAATNDVAFSNGGAGVLARFKQDGAVFELKSPWTLQKPTLAGSKATYAAVLPGVDLVVNATTDSFSYNLVVQTREAASNPALKTLIFPVTTQNLELRTTQPGRPSYVDASGKQIVSVGDALMWDNAGTPAKATGKSTASAAMTVDEGPSGEAKHALMQLDGSAAGLTVKPDQAMLTAADTRFPVVIDPTMELTKDRVGWTAAWELYPSTSFWKTEHSLGVGYEGFEQSKIVRSYYQFNTSYYTNKKIIKASMTAFETHSANCTPKGVILSRVSPISPRTTWNNQPAVEANAVDSVVDAKGWSSACPAGFLEFDVTASMQVTSKKNLTSTSFRLSAASETDMIAWKQFDARSQLHVEYVAYPLPAANLGAATPSDFPDSCAPSTDPTIVALDRPEVYAEGKVGVGDSTARVFVRFLIRDSSGTNFGLDTGLASPGVRQKRQMPNPLVEGRLYTYNARTVYPTPAGELLSEWSQPCFFKIDTKAPPPPTITASYKNVVLPDCTPDPENCTSSVPFGESVSYTIASTSTDVVSLSYEYNGELRHVAAKSVTVPLLTPNPLEMKIKAWSHDAASHQSSPKPHEINVGPGLPPVAAWNLDDQAGGTAVDAIGNSHPLTVTDAEFDAKGRVNGSLLSNGVNSRATTPATFVDTSKNFSISAWARLTGTTDSGVVTITGQATHGGQLRYNATTNRWTFIQTISDAPAQPQARVESLAAPLKNTWTHLLGVYDATARSMTLYVNGKIQRTVNFTHTPWRATGRVEVGSVRSDPNMGPGIFPGSVDEVKIFQRIVPAVEAQQLANPRMGASGHDEQVASRAATYPLDSVEASADGSLKTSDTTYDSNLTVTGFAGSAIAEDIDRGKVLATSGSASEGVAINRPLVDASGSFSVSAWVKIADPSKKQVIVRQAGTNKDSWRLEYRPGASGSATWAFSRSASDVATDQPVEVVRSTTQSDASDFWTALAVTYDAVNGEIALMVNAQLGTSVAKSTSPFSTGTTQIGKPSADVTYSPSAALIDDLRFYTGAMSEHRACVEAFEDELSCPL